MKEYPVASSKGLRSEVEVRMGVLSRIGALSDIPKRVLGEDGAFFVSFCCKANSIRASILTIPIMSMIDFL